MRNSYYIKKNMLLNLSLVFTISIFLIFTFDEIYAASFILDPQVNLSNDAEISEFPELEVSGSGDVFVIWRAFDINNPGLFLSSSSNGGNSFTKLPALSNNPIGPDATKITSFGNNVYIIWEESFIGVFVSLSNDGGQSFTAPIQLSNTGFNSEPQITTSNTNDVYAVWVENKDIQFSKSSNGGPFSNSTNLSNTGTFSVTPQIHFNDVNGNVYVLWNDNGDIFFNRITGGGTVFDAPVKITNTGFTPASFSAKMTSSGNNVYVVWHEGTDIKFTKIIDNGIISPPSNILDIGNTGGLFNSKPDIVSVNNFVYVVWEEGNQGEIKFNRSMDNGNTFFGDSNLSNTPSVDSANPSISADSSNVSVSWEEGNPSKITLSASDDNGSTFGSNVVVSSTSSINPELKMISNEVFLTWQDFSLDEIFFRKGFLAQPTVNLDSSQYKLTDTATITVNDPNSDTDASQPDTISASVTSDSDTSGLSLNLVETGLSTGNFTATFGFDPDIAASSGTTLKADAGDTITGTFNGIFSSPSDIFPRVIEFFDESGQPESSSLLIDRIHHLRITDINSNLDSTIKETITVNVTSQANPSGITLVLQETGADTAVFGGINQTSLAFTSSSYFVSLQSKITITEENKANPDPSIQEILSLVTSTSDHVGIKVPLLETGPITNLFTGSFSLTTGLSNPEKSLQVSPGDFIRQQGNNTLVNYGLVLPNNNPANGLLEVDVTNNSTDPVTVTHLSTSKKFNALTDDPGLGGGTGGLVRPGLVFDAIAGFGGTGSSSSSKSPPSFAPLQYKFLLPEILASFLDEGSDPDKIIEPIPIDDSDVAISDMPFVINNKGYPAVGTSNKISPNVLRTNEKQDMSLTLYDTGMIEHVGLYTNLHEKDSEKNISDTYILFNNNKPLEVVDPHGYFSEVDVKVTKVDSIRHVVDYDIKFAKEMEKSNIVFHFWNDKRNDASTVIYDAWEVVAEKPPNENSLLSADEPLQDPTFDLEKNSDPVVPDWVKSNARWWSEGQILDSEFAESIEYMVNEKIIDLKSENLEKSGAPSSTTSMEIPSWVKLAAEWWADGAISESEFIKSIEWMIKSGAIQI